MRKIVRAVLHEQAFVEMLTAALEVYPKEVYGLLIGSIYQNRLLIKGVIPYQEAFRSRSGAEVWEDHEDKVLKILNRFPGYSLLGDFHSHIHSMNYLSDTDIESMVNEGIRFSILVTILKGTRKKRKWEWDTVDKSLVGTFNGFVVRVKIYRREYGSRTIRKIKMTCPYLRRFNVHNRLVRR
jgi:proteasome lid subunit RPN8/RPN11